MMEEKTRVQEDLERLMTRKGDRGGPGSLAMQEDDTIRQRKEAVIEAATDLVDRWRRGEFPSDGGLFFPPNEALAKAVDALATQQPVDPQTLKPGTRFHWEGAEEEGVFRIIGSPERSRRWLNLEKNWTGVFCNEDRVIPLPDDTE